MTQAKYTDWITKYVERTGVVAGMCAGASRQISEAFPELSRVCGVVLTERGECEHWWCVAPDGRVVDPTASRFGYVLGYIELDPSDPDVIAKYPSGHCMDCGGDVYGGATFCNAECERRTGEYLNKPNHWE